MKGETSAMVSAKEIIVGCGIGFWGRVACWVEEEEEERG